MLEETLKQINKNLERIANSLERGKESTVNMQNVENTPVAASQPVQVPTNTITTENAVAPIPIAQPMQTTQTPMQAPAMPIVPTTVVPTTPATQSFTQDQLAVAMSNAVAAGKMTIVLNTLASLGVQALTDVKPEDYNKLASMLQAQGVEV